ncbi:hypothetical protein M407DRAFT_28121 [Tulasnella calospora MUT 4182]|uniref:Protein kinase domain-containing protein n=1 Tax=Tulasnella calospora MUT 4182 TaxID=1051891 RepID=A0A0C3KLU2_9AGAM|nr:hypothetical protein M407DRAFT_28121 [Tulasnella calospora MUT 4182]
MPSPIAKRRYLRGREILVLTESSRLVDVCLLIREVRTLYADPSARFHQYQSDQWEDANRWYSDRCAMKDSSVPPLEILFGTRDVALSHPQILQPGLVKLDLYLEFSRMWTFARALYDQFDDLHLPIWGPKPRTPTVKEITEEKGENGNVHQKATAESGGETSQATSERQRLGALSDFRIGPSEIEFTSSRCHGSGGKADVGQATFRRKIWTTKQLVAVKKHRYYSDINKGRFANEFIHEVEVMAGLSHENIVQLIGFVEDLENGIAWVILSWVPNGNVSEFLKTGDWEIPERVSLIKDTFEGVKYLHSRQPPICHGDLKSFNILVSASYRAVITDFGSARAISAPEGEVMSDEDVKIIRLHYGCDYIYNAEQTYYKQCSSATLTEDGQQVQAIPSEEQASPPIHVGAARNQLTLTGPAWSLRWAAPEVVKGRRSGLSSDIWAVAWVCWEVMTNNVPFPQLNSEGAIALTVIRGKVPSPREDAQLAHIAALCSLMTDCWTFDPRARPKIGWCCAELKWMPSTPPECRTPSGPKGPSTSLLFEMGETYLGQGRYEQAISLFRQALSLARVADDDTDAANALESIARAYFFQSKYKQAEEWFTQAQEIYARLGNDRGQAGTLSQLGEVYRYQSKYTEAEDSHTRAQEIFARLGNDHGRAFALRGLGHVYGLQSKYAQAEESFSRAQEIYARLGYDQGQANALIGLARVYRSQSKYIQAVESYTGAQEICARLGDDLGRANTLEGLGYIYYYQSENIQAEGSYTQAQEIYSRLGNDHGRANTLSGLGNVYRLQSKYIEAEESLSQAQQIYARIGRGHDQADALMRLGEIYHTRSRYTQAEESFMAAREIFTRVCHVQGQAATLRSMGHMRRDQGQNVRAAAHFADALKLYEQLGMTKHAEDVGRELALVLAQETSPHISVPSMSSAQ